MIRLLPQVASQLLAMLKFMGELAAEIGHSRDLDRVVRDYAERDCPTTLAELREYLSQCIQSDYEGTYESDLVDLMVKILQLPHGDSVLTGRVLSKLRDALLLPHELAGLKAAIAETELMCAGCGTKFVHGSMAVLTSRLGGGLSATCTKCNHPTYINCERGHLLQISSGVERTIAKVQASCQTCAAEAQEGPQQPEPPQQPRPAFVGEPGAAIPQHVQNPRGMGNAIWIDEEAPPPPFPPDLPERPVAVPNRDLWALGQGINDRNRQRGRR